MLTLSRVMTDDGAKSQNCSRILTLSRRFITIGIR